MNRRLPARLLKPGLRLTLYGLISYGLLYYSYKYFVPEYGGIDFLSYYNIYLHPLNLHAGDAPYVYRQLNAVLVHAVWKLGLYHPTQIAFAGQGYDQRVFFAAVLTNWLALIACATVVASAAERLDPDAGEAWPLLAGALCFFDFFAQQGVLAGLSEGVSWLLVAVGFFGWARRSLMTIAVVLALSVIQRETIPIVFGAFSLSLMALRRQDRRFHAAIVAVSLAALLAYLAMRLATTAGQGNTAQLSAASFGYWLGQWGRLASMGSLFQIVLTQNLLIALALASLLLVASTRPAAGANAQATPALYFTAVVLALVGVGALSQSNNIGRVLAILTPITAPLLVLQLRRLSAPAAGSSR